MRAAWLFLLATGLRAGVVLHPPPPYFENAAQDAKGIIWAYSRAEYNHIYCFDSQGWTEQGGPGGLGPNAMPAFVVRMTDGTVACVWDVEPHTVAVTRHTTESSTLIGQCEGKISASGLTIQPLADSQNRLWITTEGPEIYRADATGLKVVHRFAPDEYVSPNPHPEGYNKVHAVEDGLHRIWVWSDPQASNYASLRGVLVFDGDKPEMHASFGPISGQKVLAIARADDRHMFMSVAGDGIYLVDIGNFAVQRLPDPSPQALCCVHELHPEGDDLFAVEDYPTFKHSLWRRQAGQWTKLVDPIGTYPFLPRSWLTVPKGILVEGDADNLWFIPPTGPAAELSWKSGFHLQSPHALSLTSTDKIFALGAQGEIFDADLDLPPHDTANSRLVWVAAQRGWKTDANGRVWAILQATPRLLSEWDGDKWIGHAMPLAFPAGQLPTMEGDTRGQMWIEAPDRRKSVEIYDPAHDRWRTFANMDAAYLALGHQPPEFLRNGVLDFEGPVYSPDLKRVAYRLGAAYIYYYDGSKWTHFDRHQITGKSEDNAVGPPRFDSSGTLLVNLRPHLSYGMDASGKWSQLPFRSLYPDDIWSEGGNRQGNPMRQTPPEGAVTRDPDFCVEDNVGTWWLTWKGQLYRAVPGLCVPQFDPGEVNPFVSHPGLNRVFVDKNGNALFTAMSELDPFLMLRPKVPVPRSIITLQRTAPDSFTAHLGAQGAGEVLFRWQLDDTAWEQGSDRDLVLDHLPNGRHTLRVVAMAGGLSIQVAPTLATFSTNVDAARQIEELVAELNDPAYAKRKNAVAELARQPVRAIPALEKARLVASGDSLWWIDVALQEAQANPSPHPAPSDSLEPTP
jgi:hypothetical protein